MCLREILLDVGSQLEELLWQDLPDRRTIQRLEHLQGRLRRSFAAVSRQRDLLTTLGRQLVDNQRRQAWYAERVQVYLHVGDRANAWRYALDLDRLRRTIERERTQLRHYRLIYLKQLSRVRQLRRQLANLRGETYSKG